MALPAAKACLLVCLVAVLQANASPQGLLLNLAKTRLRKKVLSSPKGAAGTIKLLMNADKIVQCLGSMMNSTSNPTLTSVSANEAIEYINGMTELCALFYRMSANFEHGCGVLMESLVQQESYWTCVSVRECYHGATTIGPLYAGCLERCDVSYEKDGSVVVTCDEPILMKTGLRHDRVCGDQIPLEVYFNYLNPLEILLTYLASFIFETVNVIMKLKLQQMYRWPGVDQTVGAIYHGCVLLHIFAYMTKTMSDGGRGSACNFPMVCTMLFYSPYIFSSSQLIFKMVNHIWIRNELEAPKVHERILLLLCIPSFVVVGFIFILLGVWSLAMMLAAFWGVVAFLHITLTLAAIAAAVLSCTLASLTHCGLPRDVQAHINAQLDGSLLFFLFVLVTGTLLWTWLLFVQLNSYFLYYHGDYLKFHNSFFHEFTVPLPNVPRIKIIPFSEAFWIVFAKVMSLKWEILPLQLFEFTLVFQCVLTVAGVIQGVVIGICHKCCGPSNEISNEMRPGIQRSPSSV